MYCDPVVVSAVKLAVETNLAESTRLKLREPVGWSLLVSRQNEYKKPGGEFTVQGTV
jgi:hypothetical protein